MDMFLVHNYFWLELNELFTFCGIRIDGQQFVMQYFLILGGHKCGGEKPGDKKKYQFRMFLPWIFLMFVMVDIGDVMIVCMRQIVRRRSAITYIEQFYFIFSHRRCK